MNRGQRSAQFFEFMAHHPLVLVALVGVGIGAWQLMNWAERRWNAPAKPPTPPRYVRKPRPSNLRGH